MPYFYDCTTKAEAKLKYKELAKKLHPDKGGDEKEFKLMQSEYDRFEENSFGFRFNTINQEYSNYYDEIKKRYHGGFTYKPPFNEEDTKKDKEIERLKNLNIQYDFKVNQLINENRILQNSRDFLSAHNNQLISYNLELKYIIDEFKSHWLIGRLIRWLI